MFIRATFINIPKSGDYQVKKTMSKKETSMSKNLFSKFFKADNFYFSFKIFVLLQWSDFLR